MVKNLWNDSAARQAEASGKTAADRLLNAQIYASRLIGSTRELVQHGGGNTSCKVTRSDLFGHEINVLHIKASGRDLSEVDVASMPGVRLEPLIALRALDHLGDEDMVNAVRAAMLDTSLNTPSVEILLHAYLPHKIVNHSHATAMLALADLPDVARVATEIFGDKLAVVPFFMPGFELGRAAAEAVEANPQAEGLLLLKHGHVVFSDDVKPAYDLMVEHTKMAVAWFEEKRGKGRAHASVTLPGNCEVLPVLRGLLGRATAEFSGDRDAAMPVMDLRTGPSVAAVLARDDLAALAAKGVATPDHVIRTKNHPLLLTRDIIAAGNAGIETELKAYIDTYTACFDHHAAHCEDAKTMLLPTPNLAWIEGVGIAGIGTDAKAAGIAADMAEQGIVAMSLAADCGGFEPVDEAQMFDMGYLSLEPAQLGRADRPDRAGQVVRVTGGGWARGVGVRWVMAWLNRSGAGGSPASWGRMGTASPSRATARSRCTTASSKCPLSMRAMARFTRAPASHSSSSTAFW